MFWFTPAQNTKNGLWQHDPPKYYIAKEDKHPNAFAHQLVAKRIVKDLNLNENFSTPEMLNEMKGRSAADTRRGA